MNDLFFWVVNGHTVPLLELWREVHHSFRPDLLVHTEYLFSMLIGTTRETGSWIHSMVRICT